MNKLHQVINPSSSFLKGYLRAAQSAFYRRHFEVKLEGILLEILQPDISHWDVVIAAFGRSNPILSSVEVSVDSMRSNINGFLTVSKEFWAKPFLAQKLEDNLKKGYWLAVEDCFDYSKARIVQVTGDVPYIRMMGGFTYLLYSNSGTECLVLVGNTSD